MPVRSTTTARGATAAKERPTPRRPRRRRPPGTAGQAQNHDGCAGHEPARRPFGRVRWAATRAGQWSAGLIAALAHLSTIQLAAATGSIPLQVLAYAAPAAITLYMRPGSWRHCYRFLAPLGLTYFVYVDYKLACYTLVTAWVLRQCWAVDDDPRARRVRDVLIAARSTLRWWRGR